MKALLTARPISIGAAWIGAAFSALVLVFGYAAFGLWTTLIFASGFLGGFVLWIVFGNARSAKAIRLPYWISLGLFVMHRIEERISGFFDELARLTGAPTPDIASPQVIGLVILSIGPWLLVLPAIHRFPAIGSYLAWTFFAAMGVTELFHVAFLLIDGRDDLYFPGLASVAILAPTAWWGMKRMVRAPSENGPAVGLGG